MDDLEANQKVLDVIKQTIESTVSTTVNGKIDKVSSSLNELKTDFKAHVDIVQPIIQQFNDKKGFWNTISSVKNNIGMIVGLIVGIVAIVNLLLIISK